MDFLNYHSLKDMETFNLMVMFEKSELNSIGETWEGTVKTIKKHINQQVQVLRSILFAQDAKIDATEKKITGEFQAVNTKIEANQIEMKQEINDVKEEIKEAVTTN